jgi:twitching motility protein PilT
MDIFTLVNSAMSKRGSDLHLIAGQPPLLRIDGLLQPEEEGPPLTEEAISQAFNQITSDDERESFRQNLELDFGYTIPGVCRLRCNAARQMGTTSLVIRLLSITSPTLEEMKLPEICKELILKPRGLVMVSGPTGSGKSTTLAAMVNHLNNVTNRRVVTIEDPIEYIYSGNKCSITQRELGRDTLSFAGALKHVLRKDPDVILVGEMRDLETAATALTIAETGHLVLTTGHAPSAPQTIERIIDLFPPHEQNMARSQVASLLVGVLCQLLVPRVDGPGRVAAIEIMLANPAVRNTIREGRTHQLPNVMVTNARSGMVMMDQALVNLYRRGAISHESLFNFCNDQEEVSKLVARTETR